MLLSLFLTACTSAGTTALADMQPQNAHLDQGWFHISNFTYGCPPRPKHCMWSFILNPPTLHGYNSETDPDHHLNGEPIFCLADMPFGESRPTNYLQCHIPRYDKADKILQAYVDQPTQELKLRYISYGKHGYLIVEGKEDVKPYEWAFTKGHVEFQVPVQSARICPRHQDPGNCSAIV